LELLPALSLSDGKSVSCSTGELWNLRVSACHISVVGEKDDEGSCSLLILPTTPKRAVAASEERSIYLWYCRQWLRRACTLAFYSFTMPSLFVRLLVLLYREP
jgi:hypothetical protein